jgi:hypothetical protein
MKLCPIVISSCKKYDDLWSPCISLWKRHFPEAVAHSILATDSCEANPELGIPVLCGGSEVWSTNLLNCIKQIRSEHVLLVLDDFFLRSRIAADDIAEALKFAEQSSDILYLSKRGGQIKRGRSCGNYHEIDAASIYAVNLQPAIWRKAILERFLGHKWSPWEFEIEGSRAAASSRLTIWRAIRNPLHYEGLLTHHVVEKGKWLPHEKYLARMRGLRVHPRRLTMPLGPYLFYLLREKTNAGGQILFRSKWHAIRRAITGSSV